MTLPSNHNKYLKHKLFKFASQYAGLTELSAYCVDMETDEVNTEILKQFLIGKIGINPNTIKKFYETN